jgi:putative membrane-bound dehydrogenase-like protein
MCPIQKQIPLLALLLCTAPAQAADRPLPKAPQGFTVQLAAAEPHIKFPMFACFDNAGRLFVAESSGLDLYDELQKLTRRCRISVLEDKDNDGVFETARVFADKLVFPMGLAWRDGKLYVADPPQLVTLEDTDNDGKADKRTVILDHFGHQDNGSLHGLVFGPDGLLYMTLGQPDGYRLTKADGTVVHGTTGAVIRCRPDGSHPEILARGFENAVELAFLPAGQIIATDNWYQLPAGGVRDALVHIVEGGLYPHCADRGSWQIITGDPLPPVSLFPAVALSGICYCEGPAFPREYRDNLYTAQHNTRKVQRHLLKLTGHTFTTDNLDFITSDDPDFHPSDVLQVPDGSLLVVDTGGWYVQHCPTGKIRNSQAPGGIYRIRAPLTPSPAGDKQPPSAQESSTPAGEGRGEGKTKPLDTKAIWTFSAQQTPDSRAAIRTLLTHNNPIFAALAARTLITRPDPAAAPILNKLLSANILDIQLAAAQALATNGDNESTPALFTALTSKDIDRVQEHALIHALHHRATKEQLESALTHQNPSVQTAALLLLDQPPRQSLDADTVFAHLNAPDPQLAHTALKILQNHADWAARATEFFTERLADPNLNEEDLPRLADAITALGNRREITTWLAESLRWHGRPAREENKQVPDRRPFLLDLMSRIGKPKDPTPWIEPLRTALTDPTTRSQATATATTLSLPALDDTLATIATDTTLPPDLRLAARRATLARHPKLSADDFTLLLAQLAPTIPSSSHLIAIDLASRADLTQDQLPRLLTTIQHDPLVTPDTLRPLLVKSANPATAQPLLDYLSRALTRGWTPKESALLELTKPLAASHQPQIDQLLATVRAKTEQQQSSLDQLTPLVTGGDPTRGRALFYSTATCSTCHKAGPEGGVIGPDLTKVGAIRTGRDLLESIIFPSSTIAQGYDNYIVTLADGDVLTGFITDRSPEALTLKDPTGQSRRLAAAEIKEIRRSETSIMPQGLDRALPPDQFRDLLAYLQSLR